MDRLSVATRDEEVVTHDARFPLRAAGIDVGSNAMRMVAAEFTAPGSWITLSEQRVPVRLGTAVFGREGGRISGALLDAAMSTLSSFRQRLDGLGVQVYRAAATSAVREADNSVEFVQLAQSEAGIRLETITSGEEARLVWLAIGSRIRFGDRQWAMVDLGGGSVELALADGDGVLWSESHAMGSVRLLAELGQSTRGTQRFRRLASEYIDTLVSRISTAPAQVAGLVATGGNIEELARLAGARPDDSGVARLSLAALTEAIDLLSGLTPGERIEQLGLRPDRADVIMPAALVYERIAHLMDAEELIVPNVGLREGLLFDAVSDAAEHVLHAGRQQRDIMASALALGRRYAFDEAHARQVARLAVSLFDQLMDEHELDDHDRRILLAAALLHDIGQFISYRRHHKHSYYLIANSGLPDLSPRDALLVALVARYHRRAEPSADHEGFADLTEPERERVTRLAALLRVADALDRQHRQHVESVTAEVDSPALYLDVATNGDVLLEEWALEKKAQLITSALGLEIVLSVTDRS